MQYDMDVGGDAVPRRYLARVMAQPQRATVWGVRIRSVTPASSVRTLWLETWALPHRARLSSSSPVRTMGRLLHLVTGPTRLGAFPTSMRKHPPEACTIATRGLTACMKRPQTKHRPPCTLHSGPIQTPPSPPPTHATWRNPPTPVQPSTFCSQHPSVRKTPET